jgi:hypothetical protein
LRVIDEAVSRRAWEWDIGDLVPVKVPEFPASDVEGDRANRPRPEVTPFQLRASSMMPLLVCGWVVSRRI